MPPLLPTVLVLATLLPTACSRVGSGQEDRSPRVEPAVESPGSAAGAARALPAPTPPGPAPTPAPRPGPAQTATDGDEILAEERDEGWPVATAAVAPTTRTPRLRRVWQHKGLSGAVLRPGSRTTSNERDPTILALDIRHRLVLLEARDGRVRWRRASPAGLRWSGIRPGRDLAAIGQGNRASGRGDRESMVRLTDGELLWHAVQPDFAHLAIGVDGTGLARQRYSMGRPICPVQPLDPADGQPAGPLIPGVKVRQQSREHHFYICDTAARLLTADERRSVLAIRSGPSRLEAHPLQPASSEASKGPLWTLPLSTHRSEHIEYQPTLGLVVARTRSELVVARVDTARGQTRWLRRFSWQHCPVRARALRRRFGTDQLVRRTPGPSGRLDSLLVQTCSEVHLLSLSSGRSRWHREMNDGLVHVVGEPAQKLDGRRWLLTSGGNISPHGPFVEGRFRVVWLDPTGNEAARWDTPQEGILQAQALAGGAHAVLRSGYWLQVRERDGRVRWQEKDGGDGYLRGVADGLILLNEERNGREDFLVIDARDGRQVARLRDVMVLLAHLPAAPATPDADSLLVFARRTGGLFAMRVERSEHSRRTRSR